MKENSLWFRHDANASLDGKLLRLRARYGFEGIGIYWFLAENLYQNDGYLNEEEAMMLLSGVANAKQVLKVCFDLSLFEHIDDGTFTSRRLLGEISRRQHIVEKRKSAGRKGGLVSAKNKTVANAQANAQAKVKRVEKSRVEEIRVDNTEYMFSEYERISGRKIESRNPKRISALNRALKDFKQEDIIKSWAAMSKEAYLRGENPIRKDYFTIEYGCRLEKIEDYLHRFNQLTQ